MPRAPHRALKFGREVRTPAMQAGLVSKRLSFRDVFVGGSRHAHLFTISCILVQQQKLTGICVGIIKSNRRILDMSREVKNRFNSQIREKVSAAARVAAPVLSPSAA